MIFIIFSMPLPWPQATGITHAGYLVRTPTLKVLRAVLKLTKNDAADQNVALRFIKLVRHADFQTWAEANDAHVLLSQQTY